MSKNRAAPFGPLTSEFILVLLQVRAGLDPVRFEPLPLFVLFGPLLFVLAVVELLLGADGRVPVWDLHAWSGEARRRPLRLGRREGPAAVVRRAQAARTLPHMAAGFVKIQFDLCDSASVAGGAPCLAGAAAAAMRGWRRRQTVL